VLGPLDVVVDGAPLDLGGPRHRRLLAVLLLHAGELVPAERLIDALWDEPPPSAAAMVHVRVSELRRALRAAGLDDVIETHGSGYVLRTDEIDAREFERLVGAGRAAEALVLWRGPAYAEIADRPFAGAEVARLEALRDKAVGDRIDVDLALGKHDALVVELTALVREQPLRERPWGQLMLALYRAGRQAEALRAFQDVRQTLVERLGVEPGAELRRLHAAILRQDTALDLRPAAGSGPLPTPLTSFIGRDADVDAVLAGLAGNRLVTIMGVGGAGKSRLAIEAASRWDGGDRWLVELESLTQPGLLPHTVAAALGVRENPQRQLVDLLVDRLDAPALLVLDNCEHLVQAVAELADTLLRSCARLRILATSRERLGITGEVLRPLDGLPVPPPGASDATEVGQAPAALLLVERASAVAPGFRLTDATAHAIGQICQRLDGLPLAIELAAARANAIPVERIAERLSDRFALLAHGSRTAPVRHQALRSVVDWSYELLDEGQRRLFERLCVFSGGFTLDAVEALGGSGDGVARLVDKSLVALEHTGGRYRMLETIREYGRERLAAHDSDGTARQQHAEYYLALAERAGAALRGAEQSAWLARLATEHGNIAAALDWSLSRDDAMTAARLAGSLYQFWDLRGRYSEGRHWLTRVLAMRGPVPTAARVRALLAAGGLAAIQGDLAEAVAAGEEAADLCERAEDPTGLAHALQFLGFVAIYAQEYDRATGLLGRALDSARAAGHRWLAGRSLLILGIAALARDDHDAAAGYADECIETLRPLGDLDSLAGALIVRATAAWRGGDQRRAYVHVREGLRGYQGLGSPWGVSLGLALAAYLAGAQGDHRRAATMLGASEAARTSVGAAPLPFVGAWHRTAMAAAKDALGATAFTEAWQVGAAMSVEKAIAEADG
jgi:predicted ATPase/DNA-binding SARP family transcriptional activator